MGRYIINYENTDTRMGQISNVYKMLVGKPERKRLRARPKCRWKDNIRIDLREIGWEGVDWIHLAQVKVWWRDLVNTVINLGVL
jgi:hypothetical protein